MPRFTIAVFALLIASVSIAAPPKPEESEYIRSIGGGFLLDNGAPLYAMSFAIIKPLPENAHLKFIFQNPKKGEADIEETPVLEVTDTEILVQSPTLDCIRNKKNYLVTIEIYSDTTEAELISKHKQKIEFRVDKQIIKQIGIPIC
ncbi:MAG: hypothetical protein AAF351_13485 [Pseudomonadota bacterium]